MSHPFASLDAAVDRRIAAAPAGLTCDRCRRPIRNGRWDVRIHPARPVIIHERCPIRLTELGYAVAWVLTIATLAISLTLTAVAISPDRPDRCTTAGACE